MQAFAGRLAAVLKPLNTASLMLAGIGLVLMTVIIGWQIFGRYVLNDSPSWTEPGALLLMSWFIILGAAVGVREGDHLGFEIGLHYAPPRLRLAMKVTTDVLVIGFGIAMTVYGWQLTAKTWGSKMAGISLPQGIDYLPLVIGGVLIALFAVEKLLATLIAGPR